LLYRLDRSAWRAQRAAAIRLVDGAAPERTDTVRALFREYQEAVGVDLCFQGFAEEIASLPGSYAPPRGRLWLASRASRWWAACAAGARGGDAEMKRLYLRPEGRGFGLGRRLALAVIDVARSLGYRSIRLDTLPTMTEAIALYRSLGFVEIPPYRDNPVAGALYFERAL